MILCLKYIIEHFQIIVVIPPTPIFQWNAPPPPSTIFPISVKLPPPIQLPKPTAWVFLDYPQFHLPNPIQHPIHQQVPPALLLKNIQIWAPLNSSTGTSFIQGTTIFLLDCDNSLCLLPLLLTTTYLCRDQCGLLKIMSSSWSRTSFFI